ncbi:hypothetical protein GCK72_022364 [Caenorhabditis remanei]|uniref:Uncharacterized protein n=1 Tax=Caenorhabditis remanei TaxID=31234 RepID=A0A6A5FTK1_CAERE|nr:hypothetical protein GCK72_022364 [Caenorhabditis remanei]KAF1745917.1 hypothetical protein GCK72_022364 [Caenorhabditis remanei]
MENLTLKRKREETKTLNQDENSSGRQSPVSRRRRVESSERSTTSENGLPDMENMEEDDMREYEVIEEVDSSKASSCSDGEDADDEREEDEGDEKTIEEKTGENSKKENEDNEECDSSMDDEEESSEDDEEDDSRSSTNSDSDEDEALADLKRLPRYQKKADNDDDEEKMDNDVFYNLFVKEAMNFFLEKDEDYQLEENLAKTVWKMVKGITKKHFAIIIGYTFFTSPRKTFDHFLCEELVSDTVEYWKRHKKADGGDDFVKEVERLEEEQRGMTKKTDIEKNEEPSESVKPYIRPDSTSPVSCVPEKELCFNMLNKLIRKDLRVETNLKEWFLKELEGYGELNEQRADRAWEIVGKLDRGFHSIIGDIFYLTEKEEVDIELMLELLERTWDMLEEFGTPENW